MSWITTGAVNLVNGSNVVTGVGSKFLEDARIGDGFRGPNGALYEITNIPTNTSLTLRPNYEGATVNAAPYFLVPIEGYVKDTADALRAASLTIGQFPLTKQDKSVNLTAFAGLTGVADRIPYFTGAGALSLTTLTALARNLLDDTTQSGMQSTLGLVKQTSATDTTAGALISVGAFGLGGSSVTIAFDTAIASGETSFGTVGTGKGVDGKYPFGHEDNYEVLTQGGANANRGYQIAVALTSGRVFTRSRSGGVNTAWAEVFTSASANAITVDTGSLGYGTGSGGTVTQATSKSTEVTLNKPSGRIITAASALNAGASANFQFTNNKISAFGIVLVQVVAAINYKVEVYYVGPGVCGIRITNISAGTLSEAIGINFSVIKGATA